MNLRLLLPGAVAACVCVVAAAPDAHAQSDAEKKKKAKEHYDKGNTAYNLGRFKEAIDEFSKAYEAFPDAIFIYNIAQSHRMDENWERARFFYKRYLSLKPDASNRAAVEGWIAEAEANLKKPSPPVAPVPVTPTPVTPTPVTPTPVTPAPVTPAPDTPTPTTPTPTTPGPVATTEPSTTTSTTAVVEDDSTLLGARRRPIWLAVGAGASTMAFGDDALDADKDQGGYGGQMFSTFQLTGGYVFGQGKLRFGADGLFRFVKVSGDASSDFISLMVLGEMRYELFRNFDLRVALGGGDVIVTRVTAMNPLNGTGRRATGPISTFGFHAELAAEYRLANGMLVNAWLPSFTQASAAPNMTASHIREISFGLGVGYAF
jgi:tetratricopeptide (TPR) repeat protein